MTQFAISVGFKCTESQFKNSFIAGSKLSKKLDKMGYDIRELSFSSDRPYLINFVRNKPYILGTTNTPYVAGRYVFDTWNEYLFFALCSQTDSEKIHPGEYFTTDTGRVLQCTEVGEFYLHYVGSGPSQYPRDRVTKSTAEEIIKYYEFEIPKRMNDKVDEKGEQFDELPITPFDENKYNLDKVLDEAGTTVLIDNSDQTMPIRPWDLYQAMLDEKPVFYGTFSDKMITVFPVTINMIGREEVLCHDFDGPVNMQSFFRDIRHFSVYLSYMLSNDTTNDSK